MKPTQIDLKKFNEYVDKKLITRREHPEGGLYIWNYTPVAQFSRAWDDVTLMSRGLITDLEGNIKARPFKKFFNLEEYTDRLPDEGFTVHEKFDGSLGILYEQPHDHSPALATRGSFASDQALKGTEMLQDYLNTHGTGWIKQGYTYLFEIIYPANRIVVDYGTSERLVLLAGVHTNDGTELLLESIDYPDKANQWYNATNIEDLRGTSRENSEGYVIHFDSGLRLKLKHAEYVRLHRLLTNVSSKSIWQSLKNDDPLDELLGNVPDEFYKFVEDTIGDLQAKRLAIVDEAMEEWKTVPQNVSRKEQAEVIKQKKYPHLLFAMLTGKPIDEMTWKMVRPEYEKPFREDIDA